MFKYKWNNSRAFPWQSVEGAKNIIQTAPNFMYYPYFETKYNPSTFEEQQYIVCK
jgi:hypothetical protein